MTIYEAKISIVIPLYNKREYISRAVSSVLNQNVGNFELIIIDDGSQDDGKSIVQAINDKRIRIVCQSNQGVSSARNRGIAESNSDLIAFLDADDEWLPGFLKSILSLREKYPTVGAYGTSYQIKVRQGKTYHPKFDGIPQGWEGLVPSYFRASLGSHLLSSSSVAIPKRIFQEIGVFHVNKKLGEDLDMWLRIALKYQIAFSNIEQAVYHQDAENRTDGLPVIVEQLPYLKSAEKAL